MSGPNRTIAEAVAPTYTQDEAVALGAQRLRLRWTLPSQSQTVTLDGVVYQVRVTYRRRLSAWYLDLLTQSGDPLIMGRRLTPGWSPLSGRRAVVGGPDAVLYVSDIADPYRRDQLGRELTVTLYPSRLLKHTQATVFGAYEVEVR